jgi:hypothetical protein
MATQQEIAQAAYGDPNFLRSLARLAQNPMVESHGPDDQRGMDAEQQAMIAAAMRNRGMRGAPQINRPQRGPRVSQTAAAAPGMPQALASPGGAPPPQQTPPPGPLMGDRPPPNTPYPWPKDNRTNEQIGGILAPFKRAGEAYGTPPPGYTSRAAAMQASQPAPAPAGAPPAPGAGGSGGPQFEVVQEATEDASVGTDPGEVLGGGSELPTYGRQRERLLKRYFKLMDEKPPRTEFPNMWTPELVAEHYARMRNERTLGQIILASGAERISPLGKTLAESDPSLFLESLAQQEQVRRYQQWQADAAREDRVGEMNSITGMLEELGDQAEGTGGWKATSSDRMEIINSRRVYEDIYSALNDFKDEYGQIGQFKYGELEGGIPRGRKIANWAAKEGWGTEASKEAAKWWANWGRIYNLPERNEMFGATLTDPEKAAWASANISEDMTPDQIRTQIGKILEIMNNVFAEYRMTFQDSNLAGNPILRPITGIDDVGRNWGSARGDDFSEIRELSPDERSSARKRLRVNAR